MAGINLAYASEMFRAVYSNNKDKKCIFLSHKKEDAKAAEQIGDFLMKTVDVNIYLDSRDFKLQEAVSKENDEKIVDSIKKGLACSTHLLCITSEQTRLSWWGPYEIGIADTSELNIATLQLKEIDDVPSFLKIHKVLTDTSDFLKYCSELGRYGSLFAKESYEVLRQKDLSTIRSYIA